MKNIFFLLCSIAGLLLVSSSSSETALRILYDPRVTRKNITIPEPILLQTNKSVLVNKKRFGKRFQEILEYCVNDGLSIEHIGIFTGSFTKQKIKQAGYGFVFCEKMMVISILENSKITSIVTLVSKYNTSICGYEDSYAVRDVNRNGTSEIAMIFS
jgi:hypothetical protein